MVSYQGLCNAGSGGGAHSYQLGMVTTTGGAACLAMQRWPGLTQGQAPPAPGEAPAAAPVPDAGSV